VASPRMADCPPGTDSSRDALMKTRHRIRHAETDTKMQATSSICDTETGPHPCEALAVTGGTAKSCGHGYQFVQCPTNQEVQRAFRATELAGLPTQALQETYMNTFRTVAVTVAALVAISLARDSAFANRGSGAGGHPVHSNPQIGPFVPFPHTGVGPSSNPANGPFAPFPHSGTGPSNPAGGPFVPLNHP
jgi:hypothetical protein